ncbi:oligosaccharide flippase family protein [Paludibacteraceae bacterium OttesenSCG-928-F17]|nr:oligosaccharide flippase family protein [Paludibacteraceae bacterium OttesenSCG-928-F17]
MALPNKDRIKSLIINNKKVIENYFFMTLLQILNSLFYLIIFRYLMKTLGSDAYGIQVYVLSIVTIFNTFITFGTDMPGVKRISQNKNNEEVKRETLSVIFTAKVYLGIIAMLVFPLLIFLDSDMRENWVVSFILFAQILNPIFFPTWFFQGIQKMRVVTYIQLFFKLLSLPFIFLMVKSPDDLWIYALITTLTFVLGGFSATSLILFKYKLKIYWASFAEVKECLKDSFAFFLSNSTGIIKEQSIRIIIAKFIGFSDVTIYDLANKIIMVPRTLVMSINGALFPKLIENIRNSVVKKIIRIEVGLGLLTIIFIALIGKYVVYLLGAGLLPEAYPIAVILSVTVLTWLVVGAYIDFVFVPNNKYYFVSKNQLSALLSFFIFCFIGMQFAQNVYVLASSIALSGLVEIGYCVYLTKKYKLLEEDKYNTNV